jgi:hypothetical protein
MSWEFFGNWVLCYLGWKLGILALRGFASVMHHVVRHPE